MLSVKANADLLARIKQKSRESLNNRWNSTEAFDYQIVYPIQGRNRHRKLGLSTLEGKSTSDEKGTSPLEQRRV